MAELLSDLRDRCPGYLTIENNIFYNAKSYTITRYTSSVASNSIYHNLIYAASALMADTSGCTVGVTQSETDPSFVNPWSVHFDFHLRAGSPAIGGGIQVPRGFFPYWTCSRLKAGTDLGAYQFAALASLRIVIMTTGASTWPVWDGWTVTITGAVPKAQVAVAVESWSAALGYADDFGSFTISGHAHPVTSV